MKKFLKIIVISITTLSLIFLFSYVMELETIKSNIPIRLFLSLIVVINFVILTTSLKNFYYDITKSKDRNELE